MLESSHFPNCGVAVQICRDGAAQCGFDVLADLFAEVAAVDDAVSHLVDDIALGVGDIVVVDQLFADFEVDAFDLLLGVLNGLHEDGVFDGHVLFPVEHFEGAFDAVAAEASYEVVFDGEEELGFTWVALSGATSAQLVVDAA